MTYNVTLPRHSKIGAGASAELGSVCAQLGITRPILVTDRFLTQTGQADRLVQILAQLRLLTGCLLRDCSRPDHILAVARFGCAPQPRR